MPGLGEGETKAEADNLTSSPQTTPGAPILTAQDVLFMVGKMVVRHNSERPVQGLELPEKGSEGTWNMCRPGLSGPEEVWGGLDRGLGLREPATSP